MSCRNLDHSTGRPRHSHGCSVRIVRCRRPGRRQGRTSRSPQPIRLGWAGSSRVLRIGNLIRNLSKRLRVPRAAVVALAQPADVLGRTPMHFGRPAARFRAAHRSRFYLVGATCCGNRARQAQRPVPACPRPCTAFSSCEIMPVVNSCSGPIERCSLGTRPTPRAPRLRSVSAART